MQSLKKIFIFIPLLLFAKNCISQVQTVDSSNGSSATQKGDSLPYATLYFYRAFIPKMNAPLKKVPIYINDSLVYKLKANTYISIKVFKEGRIAVAIDPVGDNEIITKVTFGKEYFYRCSIERGLWFGKPAIETVTSKTGKEECGILKSD